MIHYQQINFNWENEIYSGYIEKEYENSFLVYVSDPTSEMEQKFTNRMVISKKQCQLAEMATSN